MNNVDLMTGYEKRIFKRWKKSQGDMLKDNRMFETTLRRALGHEVEDTLETGEVVNIPLVDMLILKKIGFDLEHPDKIDLKSYSAVLGETKQELQMQSTTAAEIFKGCVAHGTNSKPSK